jgi:phenylacetic acid degradation operon negative regulatory protein
VPQPADGPWALGYVFGAFAAEAVPGPCLVDLLQQLGVAESAARTMLSRMTRSGSLSAQRHGRIAVYRLAGSYRERFLRLRRGDEPVRWTGGFQVIMYDIGETHRRDRHALRERAAAAGFGQARPGMLIGLSDPEHWCRPWLERHDLFVRTGELRCTVEVAAELVVRAWDLSSDARTMRDFVRRLERITRSLERITRRHTERSWTAQRSFLVFSEVMRDYAHLHASTPNLPAEVTPPGWPGRSVPAALGTVSELLGPGVHAHARAVADAHGLSDLVEPLG